MAAALGFDEKTGSRKMTRWHMADLLGARDDDAGCRADLLGTVAGRR
jgi:hypothetical protein